ncbi:MAG TPA: GntR family transcriptional regulator [Gemmatimonadales bacterium]|nr:GntR family transcriptional regulator [Gemmatimonadales bacterium]
MPTSLPRARTATRSGTPATNGKRVAEDHRSDSVSLAYQRLRGLIITGELPPGARIAERGVADHLGLSRTPVRSALHRLQQEGFVAPHGRGRDQRLVVTPLTRADGREIMLIVGHLEGLAGRIAAGLPKGRRMAVVSRLRRINRQLAAESRRRVPVTRIFDLDQEFHAAYIEDVIGTRLRALHRAIKPQVERYSRLYVSSLVEEIPTSVAEHEVIIKAIAKGDSAAAQHAVETNWRNAATRLARVIDHLGERGIWHLWNPEPLASIRTARAR